MASSLMSEKVLQPQDKYIVRFPDGMRDQIRNSAEASGRSMNAEIVARLKASLEADQDSPSKAILAEHMDEIVQEIQAAMDDAAEESRAKSTIERALKAIFNARQTTQSTKNNEDLVRQIEELKKRQDLDFLLYYGKATQIYTLTEFILEIADTVPDHIRLFAERLNTLCRVGIQTLAERHDEAMFKRQLEKRSQQGAHQESDKEEDIEAPINLRPRLS